MEIGYCLLVLANKIENKKSSKSLIVVKNTGNENINQFQGCHFIALIAIN